MNLERGRKLELVSHRRDDLDDLVGAVEAWSQLLLRVVG